MKTLIPLFALALCLAGCSSARVEITEPDGTRRLYETQSVARKLEMGEVHFRRGADGSVDAGAKGVKSDTTRAIDLAEEALKRVPVIP